MQELARQCNVSVRTLERFFDDVFRVSPRKWLNAERQNRAISLLKKGYIVKEVAATLGYKNQHHFSRAFKEHYGLPPSHHNDLGWSNKTETGGVGEAPEVTHETVFLVDCLDDTCCQIEPDHAERRLT